MTAAFQLQIAPDGIAELKFNLPDEKVNKFSLPVMEELERQIDLLTKNSTIKLLKLTSGKEDTFIAGADLHSFEPAFDDPSIAEKIIQTGQRVFTKWQNLPFPTVAIIHGACLGGGLEYALSCTYRVVSDHPKTQLALPEVTLGIFPGWGGTQRLPRLIGLSEGLNMILTGKAIPAVKAFKMHLADAIVPWQFLPQAADDFIKEVLTPAGKKRVEARRKEKKWLPFLLESNPLGRSLLFSQSKKAVVEKTKGHYPAPLIALNVVEKSCTLPLNEGLKIEADTFIANIPTGFAIAKYLIALFFTQEAAKKQTGVSSPITAEPIHSAAVIGAGTMGATIGWLLADHNILTRMKDISWELIGKGISVAKSLFDKGVKARKITRSECDRRFHLLSGTIDYSGFPQAQLIIEAATENLELKRKIFQEVEATAKPDAIIASNTSSLTIAEMSQGMKHPERFLAMHFFNPVHKMPLVEIAASKQTNPTAIATAFDLCKKLGKTPMLVGDCHGFLVNRIFMPGANETMFMLEEGYSMEAIAKALLDFGMPMDPFLLADEIGNDVSYKVAKTFEHAYGERMRPAQISQLLAEKQLYGRKNGKGFYLYNGKKTTPNPEIQQLINSLNRKQSNLPTDAILPRFLYSMINEAYRCLDEKIIERPDFLDLCLIMGIGFPPFRNGGLIGYANSIGLPHITKSLKQFEQQFGPRFKPCPFLGNF